MNKVVYPRSYLQFPWWFFSIVVGLCGTVILYFVLPRTGAPRGILKGVLTFGAFVSSIAWLINSADEIGK